MISAILLAWWNWTRFWQDKNKVLLWWKPVFLYSIEKFNQHPEINEIIIVCKKSDISEYTNLTKELTKVKKIIKWWTERQFSVQNWIKEVSWEITLIHNCANPLVTTKEISDVIQATKEFWAWVVWSKAINTLKQIDINWHIIKTIPRADIYEVQTPQWVQTKIFKKLISKYKNEVFTDDVSFFEKEKLTVKIVPASKQNFKITYPEDLKTAESFLKTQIIIWVWHDSHRFDPKKIDKTTIKIWWIPIPHNQNFEANSDWDVLIHTICNAIWTAIWKWSLSIYSDKMCKSGITDSTEYLKYIFQQMKKLWYKIGNISCSIEAQKPKLEKHIPAIKKNLSKLLECSTIQIWIACTSGEWLSDFWKWLWMQCFANIILVYDSLKLE